IRDAGNRLQTMSVNCPNTKMVLGGFSQGAVVSGFTTSATVPSTILVLGQFTDMVCSRLPASRMPSMTVPAKISRSAKLLPAG
ncbi:hypothetical protein C6A85_14310, partial [Mycobacterium sp. ITM-2017-0098]